MADKLKKSFIFKGFKSVLYDNFGANSAELIWHEANTKLERLEKKYPDINKESKMMIFPAAALYYALNEYARKNPFFF